MVGEVWEHHETELSMRKLLITIVVCGLAASVLGFSVAYWAITRFEPRIYHYLLTSLGLVSAMFGFCQAFRAIRTGRISVERPLLAMGFISAGLISTLYGFWQAFRGVLMIRVEWTRTVSVCLVTAALLAALYGFWRGYRVIVRRSGS
jgi:hypothetical protein